MSDDTILGPRGKRGDVAVQKRGWFSGYDVWVCLGGMAWTMKRHARSRRRINRVAMRVLLSTPNRQNRR